LGHPLGENEEDRALAPVLTELDELRDWKDLIGWVSSGPMRQIRV